MRRLAFVSLALAVLPGCLQPESVPPTPTGFHVDWDQPGKNETEWSPVTTPEPTKTVMSWNGHIVVGAAVEPGAHFQPSEAWVEPIWKSGFALIVEDVPQALEGRLDWSGSGPRQIMMMVEAPESARRPDEAGWAQYHNPAHPIDAQASWPSDGPLCIRIPPADLVEGAYHWMAHSRFAADVRLVFTITAIGGNVSIPAGEMHGHPTDAEQVQNAVETSFDAPRPFDDCVVSLG